MVHQADKKYDPSMIVERIEELWKERDSYHRTKELRAKGEDFYFIDGPPYTSGHIHLGTAWNKILKDSAIRYYRMNGYNVRDQPGYDMHGLPIEVLVEKTLGIKNKQQIETLGVQKFIDRCKDFALKHLDHMTGEFKQLGIWMDWDNPYMTIKNEYITAAWWTMKRAEEQNLLSQDLRVLSWCPRCETALAEAELEYKDVKDPSVYIKFPVITGENEYLIIWTTTPWTLVGNLAAAVHPDYSYVKALVNKDGVEETYILLEDTHEDVLTQAGVEEFMVVETLTGLGLSGLAYTTPLDEEIKFPRNPNTEEWLHKVVLFDGVEADRSGIVHIAPGFGPEDFEIGKEYELPPFCPVDTSGKMMKNTGKYAGHVVKEATTQILGDLNKAGLLLKPGLEEHRYGHCWRCKQPIIYRVTNQWFLKITELREKMLEEVDRIKWTPEWVGTGRQRNWVENSRDWCISRQRYWGIPLPVWECDCGNRFVAGSAEDLKDEVGYKPDLELHRPYVDEVHVKCTECGKLMDRVPDVMDVWLDSAVSSWAQLGYPLKEDDFKRWWPCRWIAEGHDQTRGWFYSQLGASVVAFGRAPYDSVLTHGFILDKKGRPMSKSLGNVVSPLDVASKFGVDEFRFYILGASAPWEDLSYSEDGVKIAKRFFNILWNTYYFATTYMAIDNFDARKVTVNSLRKDLEVEDQWILSKLESLKREINLEWPKQHFHKVVRSIERFVLDDFSRWYVRLVKERAWIEDPSDKRKLTMYATMSQVLVTLSKMMAPLAPYASEEIYQNIDGRLDSVHMADWPEEDGMWMNPALEKQMAIVEKLVEAASNARQKAGKKLRWPLRRIIIKGDEDILSSAENLSNILSSQINIKEIELIEEEQEWDELEVEVMPNLDAIGPVFRQWSSRIALLLKSQDPKHIMDKMEKGEYVLGIEGQKVKITPEMLTFTTRMPDDIYEAEFDGGVLYIDALMTEALLGEAYCREVIRRIQQMRKEADLQVEDLIEVRMMVDDEMADLLMEWGEHIADQTRAQLLEFLSGGPPDEGYVVEWNIDGKEVVIGIIGLVYEEEVVEEEIIEEEVVEEATEEVVEEAVPEEEVVAEEPEAPAEEEAVEKEIPAEAEPVAAETQGKKKWKAPRPAPGFVPMGPGGDSGLGQEVGSVSLSSEVTSQKVASKAEKAAEKKKDKKKTKEETVTEEITAPEEAVAEEAPQEKEFVPATEEEKKVAMSLLVEVKGVGKKKAQTIIDAGFDSYDHIVNGDQKKLAQVNGVNNKMAKNIISTVASLGSKEDIDSEGTMACPVCGSPVNEGDDKCPRCNTTLEEPEEILEEKIEGGLVLVIDDGESRKKAYAMFRESLKEGKKGLCLSKDYPQKLKKKHGLKDCDVYWLSETEKSDAIPPKNLEKINFVVEKLLKEGGVVILDGVEYLSSNNAFKNVLRLVTTIKNQACLSNSRVIIPVDHEALGPKEFNKLKEEADELA